MTERTYLTSKDDLELLIQGDILNFKHQYVPLGKYDDLNSAVIYNGFDKSSNRHHFLADLGISGIKEYSVRASGIEVISGDVVVTEESGRLSISPQKKEDLSEKTLYLLSKLPQNNLF